MERREAQHWCKERGTEGRGRLTLPVTPFFLSPDIPVSRQPCWAAWVGSTVVENKMMDLGRWLLLLLISP
jgi:hypothetical protein